MNTFTQEQQSYLRSYLKETLTEEYRRSKEAPAGSPRCPHCGSAHVVRKGKTGGKQRYLCKCCSHTFAENVTGIFHTTSLPLQLWLSYAECVVDGFDLQECAKRTGVCTRTAESMQRRIMACAFKYVWRAG